MNDEQKPPKTSNPFREIDIPVRVSDGLVTGIILGAMLGFGSHWAWDAAKPDKAEFLSDKTQVEARDAALFCAERLLERNGPLKIQGPGDSSHD